MLAEVEAIQRAALLAREAGAKLHIVHVSSGRGVAAALEARARGVDVSIETCPHYLCSSPKKTAAAGRGGQMRAAAARRARSAMDCAQRCSHGEMDIVASDHSPAPPEMKRGGDFFRIWGGIAGVQSTLAVLLETGLQRRSDHRRP